MVQVESAHFSDSLSCYNAHKEIVLCKQTQNSVLREFYRLSGVDGTVGFTTRYPDRHLE